MFCNKIFKNSDNDLHLTYVFYSPTYCTVFVVYALHAFIQGTPKKCPPHD